MKHLLILTAVLFICLVAPNACASSPKTRPNIIFILTDDQGWNDAHFAGHPYVKTPNLDRFASQSTWFRQFYVASTVCSPSRSAFLTGRYPARHQIHGHFASDTENAARSMPNWLDPNATTLAKLLHDSGYATAHFGKWHLGQNKDAPPPAKYGFGVSKTADGSGPAFEEKQDPYFRAKSTALIVDETIKFIKEHKNQPFYANVWTLLPHAPLQPTSEQLKVYESLAPSANAPAFGPWMQKYLAKAKDLKSQMQVFCASLTDLDTQLGRLLDSLEEMKLAENTIIFYSSDNGPEDYRVSNATNAGVGNTGQLRARKRSMYEGGIRTFGLLRWPGHVAAGCVDETSVIGSVDFLPSICKVAGVSVPASLQPDGEDVSEIWLGRSHRPRTKPLYWEWLFTVAGGNADGYMPPALAIRDGDWKLLLNHDGTQTQLFEIPKDIGEEHDVAPAHPDLVQSLTAKARAWLKTLPPSKARDQVVASGKPQNALTKAAKALPIN